MKMLSAHYRDTFGCKVYKLSLDAGFTCPNRDGTLGTRGCIFCSGSGEFAARCTTTLADQLEQAKSRVRNKNKDGKYIAYFQAFTNTYADPDTLRRLYTEAMAPEDIVGLAIATRPDCLSREVISVLEELNRKKPVSVELGLQTVHEATARYIRRGYRTETYYDAVRQLKAAGLEVVTHIILGLPGESPEMAVQTTQAAVAAGTDGVKFHLLHVLRGTNLPESTVVHRITGDGAKKDLIAPLWSADKKRVLNYLYGLLNIP